MFRLRAEYQHELQFDCFQIIYRKNIQNTVFTLATSRVLFIALLEINRAGAGQHG